MATSFVHPHHTTARGHRGAGGALSPQGGRIGAAPFPRTLPSLEDSGNSRSAVPVGYNRP